MCSIMGYCGASADYERFMGGSLKKRYPEDRMTAVLWIRETATWGFTVGDYGTYSIGNAAF